MMDWQGRSFAAERFPEQVEALVADGADEVSALSDFLSARKWTTDMLLWLVGDEQWALAVLVGRAGESHDRVC